MKKVLVINFSPRKGGNSDAIAEKIAAEVKDAEVKSLAIRDMKVNPCQACDACKAKDAASCVQADDMSALLPEIDACDAMVLAGPVYFGQINGPMKTFYDRIYPFFNPGKENGTLASKFGKKAAVILCCGAGPADVYEGVAKGYADILGVAGFTEGKAYCAGGVNPKGAVKESADAMKAVEEIAAWISE